jgi:hypothetical protein
MNRTKSLAALLTVALLTAAVVPAAASAATALDVSVEQDSDTGAAMVTVTNNGTAVENATVVVDSDDEYAGTGNYSTDANGTVDLPQPDDTQNVTVTATDGNLTAETTVELAGTPDLDLAVEQTESGNVSVNVTRGDAAVENASVTVESDDEYAGTGNYSTDANGSVVLVAPEENATVNVTAAEGDETVTESETLEGVEPELEVEVEQEDAGVAVIVSRDEPMANASVTVESDGDYSGEGSYQTDADGSVDLPAPAENVSIQVTAVHEDDEATATADLTTEFVEESKNFGQSVVAFIDALRAAGFNGPPGQIVSGFVTENNPGNADDAPGHEKKEQAGAQGDELNATEDDRKAPGQEKKEVENEKGKDGERGPPEHAKNGEDGDDADEEDDTDDSEEEDDSEDDGDDADDGDDVDEEDDSEDDAEEDSDDDSEDDSDDGESGPPAHANGNGN